MISPESHSPSIWLNPKFYPSPRVRAFLRQIYEHPEMTLGEQAQAHGLSSFRFYHLLAEGFEQASRWRMRYLMDFAARMLYSGLPLKAVAADCGYAHVSDFCRAFKRYWGKSPYCWLKWARKVRDPNIIFVLPEERPRIPRWARVTIITANGEKTYLTAKNANSFLLNSLGPSGILSVSR